MRSTRFIGLSLFLALAATPVASLAWQAQPNPAQGATQAATQADRQKMMDLLHIASLRNGANGSNPQAPNYANYDESKANPYPTLPDPLVMKSGKKVTTAKMWWDQRRPEIVEDFDREIYGRMPKVTPRVKWEVIKTTNETNGDVPVVTKQLVGHVDNSSYPQITVDIQLSLSTPANTTGPVPVIMEFGSHRWPCARRCSRARRSSRRRSRRSHLATASPRERLGLRDHLTHQHSSR